MVLLASPIGFGENPGPRDEAGIHRGPHSCRRLWSRLPQSYVVSGLGCADAFRNAPQGAGRRLSRSEAKATYGLVDLDEQMAGIESRRSAASIDELPAAYKEIDAVMEHARDLVRPIHTLRQFGNVKGE